MEQNVTSPHVSIIIPVQRINDYIRDSMPYILDLDYDNLNRLRKITHSDTKVDRYSYNSAGLRFKKEEDPFLAQQLLLIFITPKGRPPLG